MDTEAVTFDRDHPVGVTQVDPVPLAGDLDPVLGHWRRKSCSADESQQETLEITLHARQVRVQIDQQTSRPSCAGPSAPGEGDVSSGEPVRPGQTES